MTTHLESLVEWFSIYRSNLTISVVVVLCYLVFRRIVFPKIEKYIERDSLKNETLKNAIFSLNLIALIFTVTLILFTWGFDFKGLLTLSTGLVAITGVAMFANWSILSNITAFFILIAHQSYRRGNFIRIIDLDNYIEGYISEINLFNTRLIGESREIIIYPNNLLIAKPIIVNPRTRHAIVGKTQDFASNPVNDDILND